MVVPVGCRVVGEGQMAIGRASSRIGRAGIRSRTSSGRDWREKGVVVERMGDGGW
jgi:hypothetical protein